MLASGGEGTEIQMVRADFAALVGFERGGQGSKRCEYDAMNTLVV